MRMIQARGLSKSYWIARHRRGALGAMRSLFDRTGREVPAVRDISFEVAAGEIVGYVGPNGAGKSTTIKMLTGILVPTAGEGGLWPADAALVGFAADRVAGAAALRVPGAG
jgi:ABC-2 type transport system ATP-binding protein